MKGIFVLDRQAWNSVCNCASKHKSVREPNENDWVKLIRCLNNLKDNADEVLILKADNTQTISLYVDAEFAVHKDMQSHTGTVMTMGS